MSAHFRDLIEPYPASMLKRLPKAGGLTYVPIEQVKQRLLALHGPYDWVVSQPTYFTAGPAEPGKHHRVSVTGQLGLVIDGQPVVISDIGTESVWEKGKDGWYVVDNATETAAAQAFKRACAHVMGLDLYAEGDAYWLPRARALAHLEVSDEAEAVNEVMADVG